MDSLVNEGKFGYDNVSDCNALYSRLFFERHESDLRQLQNQFSSSTVMDEKTELVVRFLDQLWQGLEQDPMLAAANTEQRGEARVAVERAVFSQVHQLILQFKAKQVDVFDRCHGKSS